jgi:PST family polysaccharide transporter
LLWAGVFAALAESFNLVWYYQGLERMRLVAALDISARALATAGIFLVVRSPDDGWKVLTLQGLASSASVAVALGLAYRGVPFRFPTRPSIWKALRMGWNTFVFTGAVQLYTTGNSFILGLFAPHGSWGTTPERRGSPTRSCGCSNR